MVKNQKFWHHSKNKNDENDIINNGLYSVAHVYRHSKHYIEPETVRSHTENT